MKSGIGIAAALSMGAMLASLAAARQAQNPAYANRPQIAPSKTGSKPAVDFTTQVQPIFEAGCYECHGGQNHSGGLQLDNRISALRGGASGPDILPGKAAASPLIKRVMGLVTPRMPLNHPALTSQQIATLRAWIDGGATWPADAAPKQHWSYVKPVRPPLPPVHTTGWVRNPIDRFILARLEKDGLKPSPEADRPTLIRRVSLDLIGLPPSPAEVDAFVADRAPGAYERVVDRLLNSPHYGEQWGRHWLDIARYADTNGYEKDRERTIWPYRDWVINAINADMPFNEFAIEQMAGDMLPHATPSQIVATGFHRNTMFNEEGGIDVEEFRNKALVDRVQTTASAFLGTTLQCAQCHNHKYDPISQKEYFSFYALLNNADEPEMELPTPAEVAKRNDIETRIAQIQAGLEADFPQGDSSFQWEPVRPDKATSQKGAALTIKDDSSVLVSGPITDTEAETLVFHTDRKDISAIRLETLVDPSLPHGGPGRAPTNGNFVLSEFRVTAAPAAGGEAKPVPLMRAHADFSQSNFDISNAIDGNPTTGWAIDTGSGNLNQNRTATFETREPIGFAGGTILTIALDQNYLQHSLGHFRISLGRKQQAGAAVSRDQFLTTKLADWEKNAAPKCAHWTVLDPTKFGRNYEATMTKLPDHSLLVTGDNYYRDQYNVELPLPAKPITGIRLEVLPDPSLPNNGPGRNPSGGFLLSELNASVVGASATDKPAPLALQNASADYGANPSFAIDGKKDTHWTAPNGDGMPHAAVFQVKEGVVPPPGGRLALALIENYHQQENIGRFRISVTSDPAPVSSGLPADVESILITPSADRTADQKVRLKNYFLSVTPLLEDRHREIAQLRASLPHPITTLVMTERAVPRDTHIQKRGDFLNLGDAVEGDVPAVLGPLPAGAPRNRLTLARWLVSPDNPLVGRVVMNRSWTTLFGRGIVNTVEDFGVMGEPPSHPELLDWLATEFVRQGWSMKAMHRLMVTSATYRQASQVTPTLLKRDPANVLLARGPRFRVEGENVRDVALAASGLLDQTLGGPSVYPPQPDGVSALSYGAMTWPTSTGGARYRRGVYTFLKRTSPYPGLITFDGPTSENTCPRRNRSDTPLQALEVLNDQVFMEAAQGMARRIIKEAPADTASRARYAFRLCVAREPTSKELAAMTQFYNAQRQRFQAGGADPAPIAGTVGQGLAASADIHDLAAWTLLSRALLNLDETITRE